MRAQLEKKLAQKEKEKKEQKLVELAQKAREERAGIRTAAGTICTGVGYRVQQWVCDFVIAPRYSCIQTTICTHCLPVFLTSLQACS